MNIVEHICKNPKPNKWRMKLRMYEFKMYSIFFGMYIAFMALFMPLSITYITPEVVAVCISIITSGVSAHYFTKFVVFKENKKYIMISILLGILLVISWTAKEPETYQQAVDVNSESRIYSI